jgi:hypothetical protein
MRTTALSPGAILIVAAPAIAFTLHDLVFQLPDNQHEASLGFFVSVIGLLFAWALGGYLVGRRTRTAAASVGAGASAAAASVVLLWLTFVVLNTLFTDRMSYEPDRIRAFNASGAATMREYLDRRPGVGPFPLLMAVAVLAGATGGVIAAARRDGRTTMAQAR